MTAYDTLAKLAEHELELVSAGAIDELPALHERREALVATLPATPPLSAKFALERTLALQERVTRALEERSATVGSELRKLSHGRTAVRGYAPAGERTKLVDRSG